MKKKKPRVVFSELTAISVESLRYSVRQNLIKSLIASQLLRTLPSTRSLSQYLKC